MRYHMMPVEVTKGKWKCVSQDGKGSICRLQLGISEGKPVSYSAKLLTQI